MVICRITALRISSIILVVGMVGDSFVARDKASGPSS